MNFKYIKTLLATGLLIISTSVTAQADTNANPSNKNVKALFTAMASSDPDKLAIAQKYVEQNSSADLALTMLQNSLSADKYWRSLKPWSVQSTGTAVSNPAKGSVKFNKSNIIFKSPVIAFNGSYSKFKLNSKGLIKSWSIASNSKSSSLDLNGLIFNLSSKYDDNGIEVSEGIAYQSVNGNTYIQLKVKNNSGSPKSMYFTGGIYRTADGKKINATTLPGGCFAHDQVVYIEANLTGKANIVKNTEGVLELPLNSNCTDTPWFETRAEVRILAN
jgi:hypothetical protein